MEDEEKEPQSQCAEGAAGSHHLLMQAPILAASRRPEVDEVTDKAKHRGSDEFGTAQLVDKYEVFTEEVRQGRSAPIVLLMSATAVRLRLTRPEV